jgi:pentatricopeptide repeat protein
LLFRCNQLSEATTVFEDLVKRRVADVVTFTIAIGGFGWLKKPDKAFAAFDTMKQSGIRPDSLTFTALLSCCAHNAMVEESLKIIARLKDHHVKPHLRHHNCVVDCLARAGKLQEAENYILAMTDPAPGIVTWMTLLGACRTQQDAERAARIHKLIESLPPDARQTAQLASASVLLANTYASTGRFAEQDRVDFDRRSQGLEVLTK